MENKDFTRLIKQYVLLMFFVSQYPSLLFHTVQ